MRLDKFVSHASDLSRAEVKRAIKFRQVHINGVLAESPKQVVKDSDRIELHGDIVTRPSLRYLMAYKPAGCVSATFDTEHLTILDVIGEANKGLSIAGRLDKDTTGLVLISDDGQWIHNVTSPRKRCAKTYIATLDGPITQDTIDRFADGILLRSETDATLPAQLKSLEGHQSPEEHRVQVEVVEGKYHQIKRMFAACGLHVESLHRVSIGGVMLDEKLSPGDSRALTTQEMKSFHS